VQPRLQPLFDHQTINHHVDVMAELLVEHGRLIEVVEHAIDLDTLEPLLAQLDEFLAVFAFSVAQDGGEQIGAGALLHRHHPVHHVLHLLCLDGQAGGRRIGRPGAGEKQAQVVVDLRHRANGRAGVLRCGLLLDGNRG
jgi:hypothetical protein